MQQMISEHSSDEEVMINCPMCNKPICPGPELPQNNSAGQGNTVQQERQGGDEESKIEGGNVDQSISNAEQSVSPSMD